MVYLSRLEPALEVCILDVFFVCVCDIEGKGGGGGGVVEVEVEVLVVGIGSKGVEETSSFGASEWKDDCDLK